ncbi:MAG: YraN family protein [Myxococcota bacterium]
MTSRTEVGRRAEELAWSYLSERGYRLVARNHRGDGGEVDIIAWDSDTLCFVEVRARSDASKGDPLETIDRRKIARIGRAARHWLNSFSGPWPEMRFDAVGVELAAGDTPAIRLIQGAFEL